MRGKLIKIKASYKLSEMVKKEKVTTTTTKAAKVNTKKKPRKTRATKITKAVRNTVLKTGSDRPVRPVQPGTRSQSNPVKTPKTGQKLGLNRKLKKKWFDVQFGF